MYHVKDYLCCTDAGRISQTVHHDSIDFCIFMVFEMPALLDAIMSLTMFALVWKYSKTTSDGMADIYYTIYRIHVQLCHQLSQNEILGSMNFQSSRGQTLKDPTAASSHEFGPVCQCATAHSPPTKCERHASKERLLLLLRANQSAIMQYKLQASVALCEQHKPG